MPASRWRQEFRCGLWVSTLMPHGAPAVFWYPQQWHDYGLDGYQAGVLSFNRGEDRRGKNLRLTDPVVLPPGCLDIQAMQSEDSAYLYVYDFDNLKLASTEEVADPVNGARVILRGLADGEYQAEFWDTLSGQVVGMSVVAVADGTATIQLPSVAQDLAVKIKRVGG